MEAYIYGGIFALSNKLQLIGDKLDCNISTKQWFLIAIIVSFQDEAPTISMTAERMGTSRQNIKKMANILEQRGFLVIVRDKEDGRIQRLELTEYCIDYFDQRREREEKYMESLFADFDKEMLFVFFRGMKQFERNINRMEKENEEKG
ncbi:MarR family winged helix-turn-helix transcriptional regulator [Clostridium intestinale]|uniref:MarR family winged helix-turn-helix transcriptional regulator n=1 Tax=Clostridium intestinale TaxID=36845 RepID=UPI002DD62C4D|nr:MarR family transcriptional regulator [Clostridium intestinale]WRY52845.1 MarR family transcriptional regulator [Clostridium intestinale]